MKNRKLMTIGDFKKDLIDDKDLKSNPPHVAPVIDLLQLHTVANGLINPQSGSFWDQFLDTWNVVIVELIKRNFPRPAITVVSACYDHLDKLQASDDKRYHKSPTLQFLFEDTSDAALVRWNRDYLPHRERLAP